MDINFINTFIKFIGVNFCISFMFFKIINYTNVKKSKIFILLITSISLAFIQSISIDYIPTLFRLIFIYYIYSFILSKLTGYTLTHTIVINIISISISFVFLLVSSFTIICLFTFFTNIHYTNPIVAFSISCLNFIAIYSLFKIKRFKNGFPFINKFNNNTSFEIIILMVNIIILFIYFLIGNFRNISFHHLSIGLLIYGLFLFIIIQKTLILYQKQKLLTQTLKDYETELAETKTKLNTALEDKHKLVKANHEFYHRQEALKQKLNLLINKSAENNYNLEISEEYSSILDRINTLSEEYKTQTKSIPNLPKTNIPEIDDMFTYLQSECIKNNIEFIVKINCDTTYLIEKLIPKNKLETLIADLTRNAIIAINHSDNNFKSIMIILGIHDNCYEFCIYDSGIEFTPNTLLNLGLKPASTHESEGGTGIGWLTTFETLNYCKASLIITEMPYSQNNYIKSIAVKFDNNNNYCIHTYRCDELSNYINSNRDIIIKSL